MDLTKPEFSDNKLLSLLPSESLTQAAVSLEFTKLARGTQLAAAGKPIDHVYFLTSGIGSVLAVTPEGSAAEAGIFGREGYIPTSAVSGSEQSAFDVTVQIDAAGYRIPFEEFRRQMESNRAFAKVMIRAIEAFAIQLAYTAVSNAVHDVTERLARWILMCHDRVAADELPLTHEFISTMLAVRRPSVTTALHVLEGNHFIRAERGMLTIRNRPALVEFARDAYGKPEQEYRRLMSNVF
jgi:CRP-like cAMP-binding protein